MIDTSLSSSNFYFLAAVVQGIILSLFIIFIKPKKKPNVYLGILIFLFSSALLHSVLESSIHAFNSKFPIPLNLSFAYGPLAYLHILHIKNPLRSFQSKDLVHFIPSLVFDILLFTLSFLFIRTNMEWAYKNIPLIQTIALIIAAFGILQLTIYSYLIYKESRNTDQVLKEFKHVKTWLSILIISWSMVVGFLMIAIPLGLIFIDNLDENTQWLYKPLGTIKALWIYILGYLYLTKYAKHIANYMSKTLKFDFTLDEMIVKKNKLLEVLKKKELYKNPQITLTEFAAYLDWPVNKLSKIINETLQTNFSDLINKYRVEAFKEISSKPDKKKYSILGLAQEVGFSSKASFYRVFKKETGMTPSEYIKSQE